MALHGSSIHRRGTRVAGLGEAQVKKPLSGFSQTLSRKCMRVVLSRGLAQQEAPTSSSEFVSTPVTPAQPSTSDHTQLPQDLQPKRRGPLATLTADKDGSQQLMERERPLSEYMALPASQYSVLDARRIERLDDNTFRCYVGELRILQWKVEPVLTLSVTVDGTDGCTIRLLSCKLEGSKFIQRVNDQFSAQMTNVVRYRDGEVPGSKQIVSKTSIQVVLEVPAWCSFVPASSIAAVGSSVLQNVLNLSVPRFMKQLAKDYELWAAGDTSRMPVGDIMGAEDSSN